MCSSRPSELVVGLSSYEDLMRIDTPIIGATAFWHKSVFEEPLPNVRLDDVMIRWVLQMQNRVNREPIWMWCSDIKAVEYYIGSGMTNEMLLNLGGSCSARTSWLNNRVAQRKLSKVMQTAWQGVMEYYRTHGAPREFCLFAERKLLGCKTFNGTTFSRTMLTFTLMPWCISHVGRGFGLLYIFLKTYISEFFGITVASYFFVLLQVLRGRALGKGPVK